MKLKSAVHAELKPEQGPVATPVDGSHGPHMTNVPVKANVFLETTRIKSVEIAVLRIETATLAVRGARGEHVKVKVSVDQPTLNSSLVEIAVPKPVAAMTVVHGTPGKIVAVKGFVRLLVVRPKMRPVANVEHENERVRAETPVAGMHGLHGRAALGKEAVLQVK
jgi:RNase P/RNase MRP subunit p29